MIMVMIFRIFFLQNENEIFNVNDNWLKRQWRKINHVRETNNVRIIEDLQQYKSNSQQDWNTDRFKKFPRLF